MQYTGRSFAEMIAEHLLPRFLRPHTTRQGPQGLFPSKSDFGSDCPDPVSEKVYEPFFRRWAERFSRLRILQQGQVHIYLIYILLMVVLALAWVSLRTGWTTS
jgi:hydrogenase-4 component B